MVSGLLQDKVGGGTEKLEVRNGKCQSERAQSHETVAQKDQILASEVTCSRNEIRPSCYRFGVLR